MNRLLELETRKNKLETRKNKLDKKLLDDPSMDSSERDRINAEMSEVLGKMVDASDEELRRIAEAAKEQSRTGHPAKSAKLSNYVLAALDPDAMLTGAEAELNVEERLNTLDGLWVPAVMVDQDEEQRADDISPPPSDTAVNSSPILGRVFARSLASYLGCQFPTVPVGSRLWTSLASGSTPSTLAVGGSIEAGVASWVQVSREPVRASIRTRVQLESLATIGGIETALKRDAAAQLSNHIDQQIVSGSGVAPNPSGLLTTVAKVGSDPTDVTDFAAFHKAFIDAVEGVHSESLADLQAAFGLGTWRLLEGLTTTKNDIIADRLTSRLGGFRASKRIPAPVSTIQSAIVRRTVGTSGALVCPIWNSGAMRLIADDLSDAQTATRNLTWHMLYNVAVLRAAAFKHLRFKVA